MLRCGTPTSGRALAHAGMESHALRGKLCPAARCGAKRLNTSRLRPRCRRLERKAGVTNATLDNLDPLIEEAMEEWQGPRLAIAVVHQDEPVLLKTCGQRDVEARLPLTTQTQFL